MVLEFNYIVRNSVGHFVEIGEKFLLPIIIVCSYISDVKWIISKRHKKLFSNKMKTVLTISMFRWLPFYKKFCWAKRNNFRLPLTLWNVQLCINDDSFTGDTSCKRTRGTRTHAECVVGVRLQIGQCGPSFVKKEVAYSFYSRNYVNTFPEEIFQELNIN